MVSLPRLPARRAVAMGTERDHGGHRDMLFEARFSPDGRRVLTASADSTARIHDVSLSKPLAELIRLARRRRPRTLTPEEAQTLMIRAAIAAGVQLPPQALQLADNGGNPLEGARRMFLGYYEFSKVHPDYFSLLFVDSSTPISDLSGNLVGYLKVRGIYTVSGSGHEYTGTSVAQIFDTAANLLFEVQVDNEGRRIVIELP